MMPLATPPLDSVDMVFLQRAEAVARRPVAAPARAAAPPPAVDLPLAEMRPEPARGAIVECCALPRATTLVERLMAAVPEEWLALAARVEEACARGAGVIAVAGGRAGEGRSTVVACLAQTLADRGHAVEVHDRAPVELPPAPRRERYSIALVDAGVWFPGGPLRRSWLAKRSLGCQAAILVRRADEAECPAREAALAAVGVVALGEVLTMAPPTTHSIRVA
jgi:hypothetical protein